MTDTPSPPHQRATASLLVPVVCALIGATVLPPLCFAALVALLQRIARTDLYAIFSAVGLFAGEWVLPIGALLFLIFTLLTGIGMVVGFVAGILLEAAMHTDIPDNPPPANPNQPRRPGLRAAFVIAVVVIATGVVVGCLGGGLAGWLLVALTQWLTGLTGWPDPFASRGVMPLDGIINGMLVGAAVGAVLAVPASIRAIWRG
jgi:hypothetical protein